MTARELNFVFHKVLRLLMASYQPQKQPLQAEQAKQVNTAQMSVVGRRQAACASSRAPKVEIGRV